MAFRRRRKARGIWVPQLGFNRGSLGDLRVTTFDGTVALGPLRSDVFTDERAFLVDFKPETFTGITTTLADIQGNGLSIRRIVGRIYVQHISEGFLEPDPFDGAPAAALVTAAFMIRRTDDGGVNSIANANMINPQLMDNTSDPWIWRQTWLLGNNFDAGRYPLPPNNPVNVTDPHDVQDFESNNTFSGNAKDCFFDIKTRRNVLNEERLFFQINAMSMPNETDYTRASKIYYACDWRVFAFMRRTQGNRGNATR